MARIVADAAPCFLLRLVWTQMRGERRAWNVYRSPSIAPSVTDVQHRRSLNRVVLQRVQCAVGFVQREHLHSRANGDLGSHTQKIFSVLTRIVCNAANLAFLIQQIVSKRWYLTHVDSAQDQFPSLAKRLQRRRDNFTSGSKNDGGIKFFRRLLKSPASPCGAELQRQLLVPRVPRRRIDFDIPVARDLYRQVRGRPKTVKAEPFSGFDSRQPKRAKADNSRAKQRRRLLI